MKNTVKRALAAALALAAVFALFAGCKKKGNETNNPKEDPNDLSTQYTYVPSYVTLPKDVTDMGNSCVKGDKIFYISYVTVKPDGTVATQEELDEYYKQMDLYYAERRSLYEAGEITDDEIYRDAPDFSFTSEQRMYSINTDGTGLTRLPDYKPTVQPDSTSGGSYIQNITVDAQGNICAIESVYQTIFDLPEDFDEATGNKWDYYVRDEQDFYIRRLSDTGAEISNIRLNEYVDTQEGNYFYVNYFTFDKDGNLYFDDGSTYIYVISPDGAVKTKIELNGRWIQGYINLADGKIGVSIFDNEAGKQQIKTIDLASSGWGTSYDAPANAYNFLPGGGKFDFCYNTGSSMFGYDIATQTNTKIITWLNNDVDGSNLQFCELRENGDLFIIAYNYDNDRASYEVANLVRTPLSEVKLKAPIVFACAYLDYNLRNAILKFNRTDPDYRLEVRDYSEYNTNDDYEAGITKLNTEIISGNIPDILYATGLPIKQYAAKGLLADLYPFIDKDTEFSREDFVQSILKVMEDNGKLYTVTNSFEVRTIAGKASVVGSEPGWTMSEFQAMIKAHPEADKPMGQYMTRDAIFDQLLTYSLDSYADWMTGKCDFDSADFKSLLEFAKSFPTEQQYNDIMRKYSPVSGSSIDVMPMPIEEEYVDDATLIRQGRMLASFFGLYNFNDFQWNKANFGGDIVFKGIPSNGGGGHVAGISSGLAMTSSCKNKDAAWKFMRILLTEDYQRQNSWSFPTNMNVMNEKIKEAMTEQYDAAGNRISKGGMSVDGGETVEFYALTQAEIDQVMAVINGVKYTTNYDTNLVNIITDEAEAYFAGDKTVDETAALIQSRMRLYINEQR